MGDFDEADDWGRAVDDTVAAMLEAAGCETPPIDAVAVARAQGIVVASDDAQAGRGRYVRLSASLAGQGDATWNQPSIFVRSDERPERKQWAVAHELGEHAAPMIFAALGSNRDDISDGARERIANLFASRLLLPSEWFAAESRICDNDLHLLKEKFATASHELIARRMLDLDTPVVMTICDQGRVTFRRGVGRVPPMSSPERGCWLQAHQTGQDSERRDAGLLIRAWAIHEPHWRREIVRCEILEGFDDACQDEVC